MNREPEFEPQNTTVEPLAAEPLEEQPVNLPVEEPEIPMEALPSAAEIDRRVRGGMFGMPEIIVFAFSCLILLGVLGFYFLVVAPAGSDLKTRKAQHDEQETKLKTLQVKYKDFTKTEEFVSSLEQSVSDFEFRYLPIASIGKSSLYDRLNGLMYAYHLRNTAGPDYVPLEIVVQRSDQPEERGKNKYQSLFPGIYINMTVEGSYVNLRRFIGEVEASPQFVIISTAELQATENKDTAAPGSQAANPPQGTNSTAGGRFGPGQPMAAPQQPLRPTAPKGKTLGEVVSLHIELAAYFRREAAPGSALLTPAKP